MVSQTRHKSTEIIITGFAFLHIDTNVFITVILVCFFVFGKCFITVVEWADFDYVSSFSMINDG